MDISSMHNTITPVANQILDVNVEAYGNKFTGASYKVYTMDGASQLEHKKIKKVGKGFTLDLSGKKVLDEERILEVRLNRNGDGERTAGSLYPAFESKAEDKSNAPYMCVPV